MERLDVSRRAVLRAIPGLAFGSQAQTFAVTQATPEEQFRAIERSIGGRLGVAAIDTGTARRLAYRGEELFAMCSTFKLLLAGYVLARVDAGKDQLSRPILYTDKDLLEYAPITRAHVSQGSMSVGDFCAAAVEQSDNTAANLLLAQIGGPEGLTQFIRSIGDRVTRLDRTEPDLNTALPGDRRDTTSPTAMLDSAVKLLTGEVLTTYGRLQLASWMERSTTGQKRLRAGFPSNWRAGDKTGTGDRGAMGDVGIFWPPGRPPILAAVYLMEGDSSRVTHEQGIAAVGKIVASGLQ